MLSAEQILAWTSATLRQPGKNEFTDVSIDSRTSPAGSLFVALKGKKLDGHAFLDQAVFKGVAGVLTHPEVQVPEGLAHFVVEDTTMALRQIGRGIREQYQGTLIAVAGSAGKTTTKELLYKALSVHGATAKNAGNLNNLFGVPLSLVRADQSARFWVMECGISTPDEMKELGEIICPDAVVFTNVRPVHLEFFGSVEEIAIEKVRLLEAHTGKGPVVINGDDPLLMKHTAEAKNRITFGEKDHDDVQLVATEGHGLEGQDLTIRAGEQEVSFRSPLWGEGNRWNDVAALATVYALGLDMEPSAHALQEAEPGEHRGQVYRLEGYTIIDDCYNANPASMEMALRALANTKASRRVAVVGDMLELGDEAAEFHRQLGREAAQDGVDLLIAIGDMADYWLEGFAGAGGTARAYDNWSLALREMFLLQKGDLVLVKGSRGVELDRWVNRVLAVAGAC